MAGLNSDLGADPGPGAVRRLGILGGTFDPIHHGHLFAAEEARHQLALDRVLFLPAGQPPHKPARPISPARHRIEMVELAIAARSYFSLSRVDVERSGPCYTADTLQLLRDQWGPDPAFFFVVGTDSLAELKNWHQPRRLIALADLAVVARGGVKIDLAQLEEHLPGLAERVHWVPMPRLEISSSDLRARVRAGRPISYLLPSRVETYIREHGLYL